jgi:hypothetical protein
MTPRASPFQWPVVLDSRVDRRAFLVHSTSDSIDNTL